jgi:hypothetical protein
VDKDAAAKKAALFWLIGLIFSIALVLVQMYETALEEAYLLAQAKELASNPDEKI